ncbi:hypothetical protein GN956_G25191 [Arapaima gigas]
MELQGLEPRNHDLPNPSSGQKRKDLQTQSSHVGPRADIVFPPARHLKLFAAGPPWLMPPLANDYLR